jgi:8-oxo-dGTP pyrophosphatase MutT (NUDIX family)
MTEVKPLPAATVTLVRDAADGFEVLMLQRNLRSAFVPGAYVFPGGALDAADGAPQAQALCNSVSDEQASRLLGMARGGLAYWIAAIRESFEEAGLLFAYDESRRMLALDDTGVALRFRRHRDALNNGERGLHEILSAESLMLAADQLVYFSHWITPARSARRYDTRFFAALAPPAQVPLHDNQETIDHIWIRPGVALDRHKREEFSMRLPTVRTLEELAACDSADSVMRAMRAKSSVPEIQPRINSAGIRVLPGEPGYDELAANAG